MFSKLSQLLAIVLCLISLSLSAQNGNISIGPDDPDASAALDVQSTTQGVLLPRMTTAQRNAIASPAEGLLVFDSDEGGFYFYQNAQWNNLSAGGGGVSNWTVNGDDIHNNNSGFVGINHATPETQLEIGVPFGTTDTTSGIQFNSANRRWRMTMGGENATGPAHFQLMYKNHNSNYYASNFYVKHTGQVGIGTTDPQRRLHVSEGSAGTFASSNNSTAVFESPFDNYISMFNPADHRSGILFGNPSSPVSGGVVYNAVATPNGLQLRTNGNTPRMVVDAAGAVGIGTTDPRRKFHVSRGSAGSFASSNNSTAVFESPSDNYISMFSPAANESGILFGNPSSAASGGVVYNSGNFPNGLQFRTNGNSVRMTIDDVGHVRSIGSDAMGSFTIAPTDPSGKSQMFLSENSTGDVGMKFVYNGVTDQLSLFGERLGVVYGPHMLVNRDNGQMAIGTSTIADGYQLSVGGKIACEEVFVELETLWPDYVFTPAYDLKSLSEVEAFIKENGHLPGIPSAKEIDGKGIQVGEMNRLLVEKVEELTLHMIAQQKQIDEQAAIIQQLTNE